LLLLVEVADTTVPFDRTRKRPLYARAGIAEVWLVDIPAGIVEVATEPGPDDYLSVRAAMSGEDLSPVSCPS